MTFLGVLKPDPANPDEPIFEPCPQKELSIGDWVLAMVYTTEGSLRPRCGEVLDIWPDGEYLVLFDDCRAGTAVMRRENFVQVAGATVPVKVAT